ncbi:MAG: peptide chain release factor N(5)-glutamine methyltransferase [Planctomycetales bacterium]|nr:peptide chain release factor N(5)-glutamine methyltransferase [Planctomycetales bacterium]
MNSVSRMTADPPWTIGRLLTWTAEYLRDKNSDSPRLDAEVLLAHARGCQRIDLYTVYDQAADEQLRTQFRDLVTRRAAGTPVAYLVGHREFFSLSFQVSPDVLIPRPETESLVVRALDLAKAMPAPIRIADVGTGSGVLAVCCAKRLPTCSVTAIDLSPAAVEIARQNAAKHKVAEQIELVCSDLFAECPDVAEFDLILSNPPYVATSEMAQLAAGVRDHEPQLALDGGEQGTAVIERLIPQAIARLKPNGWLLMEVSPNNASRVEQLLADSNELAVCETINDLAGLPRVAQAQRKGG